MASRRSSSSSSTTIDNSALAGVIEDDQAFNQSLIRRLERQFGRQRNYVRRQSGIIARAGQDSYARNAQELNRAQKQTRSQAEDGRRRLRQQGNQSRTARSADLLDKRIRGNQNSLMRSLATANSRDNEQQRSSLMQELIARYTR